jgi:hypothetical protein
MDDRDLLRECIKMRDELGERMLKAEAEVERLRKWEEAGREFLIDRDSLRVQLERVLAENERLRADMVTLTANLHARELDGYRKREAEIERLRAALASITNCLATSTPTNPYELAARDYKRINRGGE